MQISQTLGIIIGILGFLFLITVHEGGHCFAAKMLGIRVNEFSVGMGPKLCSFEKKGTVYSFRALPIGGYCALEGEFPEDMSEEDIKNYIDKDPNAFINQPAIKQIAVLLAGPFINFVFGFLLFVIVYTIIAAGQYPVSRILEVSWSCCSDMVTEVLAFLGGLFNGSSSVDDVSGVVGIVSVMSEVAEYGLINVVYFIGLLSVNLGIMNMLPIPGLDGGRFLITVIKWILHGKLSSKAEGIINAVGTGLLLVLVLLIAVKDIINLF